MKRWTAQEHADHICRVLGLDADTARLSGLATYLETYVMRLPTVKRERRKKRKAALKEEAVSDGA